MDSYSPAGARYQYGFSGADRGRCNHCTIDSADYTAADGCLLKANSIGNPG